MDRLRSQARPDPLQELAAGVGFWRTKLGAYWPADFHNADYKKWANENPGAPCRHLDITGVTWAQVAGFATLVGEIKPMKDAPSPVFTSKFCHFLLPKVFPVVDNEGSGSHWRRYEQYFMRVRSEWAATDDDSRCALIDHMSSAVEAAGAPVVPEFPMVNKIVELRLIGRQHPLG